MSLPSKSISQDEDGRLRINQAASNVAHAKVTVTDAGETELTAGLANRRKLIIKPLRTGPILIGPGVTFTSDPPDSIEPKAPLCGKSSSLF